MSQPMNTSTYSLRSQCRHGSCNCRNAPNLPRSRRRSRYNSKTSSSHELEATPSDLSDLEIESTSASSSSSVSLSQKSSIRYSSSRSTTVTNCVVLSTSQSNLLNLNDSDYNSNTDDSISSDSSSDKKLRSILITNSEERSKSHRNGLTRNVTFGGATTTPLSSLQFNKEQEVLRPRRIISSTGSSVSSSSSISDGSRRSVYTKTEIESSRSYNNDRTTTRSTIIPEETEVSNSSDSGFTVASRSRTAQVGRFVNTTTTEETSSQIFFMISQCIKFLLYPLYWLLVQCLVVEKWVLRRDERSAARGRVGGDRGGWRSSMDKYFSGWGWRSKTRMKRNDYTTDGEGDGYYSDDDVTTVTNHRKLNGRVETMHHNSNGHGYRSSTPVSSTASSQVRARSLLKNARTEHFSTEDNHNSVSMSNLGRIAGWQKNLLIFWNSKPRSQSENTNTYVESDDEDQFVAATRFSWLSRVIEIGKIFGKLLLLLLALFFIFYLWYLLMPFFQTKINQSSDLELQELKSKLSKMESDWSAAQRGQESNNDLLQQQTNPASSDAALEELKQSLFKELEDLKIKVVQFEADMSNVQNEHKSNLVKLDNYINTPPTPAPAPEIDLEKLKKAILLSGEVQELEMRLDSKLEKTIVEEHEHRTILENLFKSQPLPPPAPEINLEDLKKSLKSELIDEIEIQVKTACITNCPEAPEIQHQQNQLTVADVEAIIYRALGKYDADKTGVPDLALEPAGGSILSTRCTKSSKLRHSIVSFWGFKIWSPPNNPRTIIQPGVVPGECWAFEGSVGDVVIKLISPSIVTGFTMEHIPKSVSPYKNIDSAPKKFQVLGLHSEEDVETAHDYGTFTYEDNDQAVQYFSVVNPSDDPHPIVELKILSNHGNMHHTCLYRFRVHGQLVLGGAFTATVQAETEATAAEAGEDDF